MCNYMNDSNRIFAAKYAARSISTWDIVKFADTRLNDGDYSDHYLAILDEDTKVWSTVSPHLEKAFREKGMTIPEFEEAIGILVEHHFRIVVDDCISPRKQIAEMLRDIENFDLHKNINKYVGDNIGISMVYGWFHADCSCTGEIDSSIVRECAEWLSKYGGKH